MEIQKTGTNLTDVQEMNRSLVIRLLHKNGLCSRTELAKATGLKQATITNITNDLLAVGLIEETGFLEGKKGRRSVGIRLKSREYKLIGMRLARKFLEAGLFDLGGVKYDARCVEIAPGETPAQVVLKMKTMIGELLRQLADGTVTGIGIALPGPLNRREGKIALMTEFAGWEDIRLQQEIQREVDCPVYVEHDANCGAMAEWLYGEEHEDGTMLYIAAGQGVGAGILIDGKLFRGTLGTAGEIGHMSIKFDGPLCECGNRGCLELYGSIFALQRRIRERLPEHPDCKLCMDFTRAEIFTALKNNDRLVCEEVRRTAKLLAIGLANVANAFNPDTIIIGDELSGAGEFLLTEIREGMRELLLPQIYGNIRLRISSFRQDAALMGAGALAANEIFRSPSLLFGRKA